MLRRALFVGIDRYDTLNALSGCARDAETMAGLLARHADGRPNFTARLHTAPDGGTRQISRVMLRELLRALFAGATGEVAFYFAGHGALTDCGAFLCASDAEPGDLGVSMDEVLQLASHSRARSVLIILDCCHAGALGNPGVFGDAFAPNPLALLRQDVTILAATRPVEAAVEMDGHGIFTSALVRALGGGAADVLGQVTAPAMYTYVERRFNGWQQRPTFKSHATGVLVVRECAPSIARAALQRLPEFFPTLDAEYRMDPDHEEADRDGHPRTATDERKVAIGRLFKVYRDAGLLIPTTPGEQLFWTAHDSHAVALTPRGQEYLWLVRHGHV